MMYTKKELKLSLFSGLNLMRDGSNYKWATFDEIEELRERNYWLVNDQKRLYYRSWAKNNKGKR